MIKSRKTEIMIYLLFFAVILLVHLPLEYISDDKVNIFENNSLKIKEIFVYYFFHNGRMFSDTLANIFYRIPFLLWKIIDSLVYIVLAKIIVYVFTESKCEDIMMVCILILFFPLDYLSSAGYIATSTNYVYTLMGAMSTLVMVKMAFESKKVSIGGGYFNIFWGSVCV